MYELPLLIILLINGPIDLMRVEDRSFNDNPLPLMRSLRDVIWIVINHLIIWNKKQVKTYLSHKH